MRQAGRALPEYRRIKGVGTLLEIIKDPNLVAEITVQPVRRYGVDAAVLYSDIMVPLLGAGVDVEIVPGKGPVITNPFRDENQLRNLRVDSLAETIPYVHDAIVTLQRELTVPLIGFTGGPFTVASYLVEGGASKNYERTKGLMLSNSALWIKLMQRLTDLAIAHITLQVRAGVDAIQVFDSWIGSLAPHHYERYVKPFTTQVFSAVRSLKVPGIHFGVGTYGLIEHMSDMDLDVLGVDWRTPLGIVRQRLSRPVALQGNLDPTVCFGGQEVALNETRSVLADARGSKGYIFNLGHGVLPDTDPDILRAITDLVHEEGAQIVHATMGQDLAPEGPSVGEL
jgi:uroporphyrinogen decarboxylase